MENIDLTSLRNAIQSLGEVLELYTKTPDNKIYRDSMIQRFEYTYSLTLKMIKRFFKNSAFVIENIDAMTFNEMIRRANILGLLPSNVIVWDKFRQMRNLTSHTYDEELAIKVVSIIPEFYNEVKNFLNSLDVHND